MADKKGIFRASYLSTNEILEEQALKNKYFDTEYYDIARDNNQGYEYLSVMASLNDNMSPNFNTAEYEKLTDKSDRFNYLVVENLYDKNSEEYKQSRAYFDQKFEQIKREEIFNGLSDFEKSINSLGGIVGNALNDLLGGTVEGLLDVGIYGAGAIASIFDPNAAEAAKKFIAVDATGYNTRKQELADWMNAYTWVDKNQVLKIANDVTSGLARMAPLAIPGAGAGIYYASMAGNTLEEAIHANTNIDYLSLGTYAGAVTGLEALIEWGSGKVLKFDTIGSWISGNKALSTGSWIADMGFNFLSEGIEEMTSEITNSLLNKALVDPTADLASLQDVLYAGLIGGITGAVATGGTIASTQRLAVKNGELVSLDTAKAEYAKEKAKNKEFEKDYKAAGLGKSYAIAKAIDAFNTTQTSAKTKLMAKYNKLSEAEIKEQHASEYAEAVSTDSEQDTAKLKATKDLVQLMNAIGVKQFEKSTQLLNKTLAEQQQYVDNYLNKTNTQNKVASDIFSKHYPGKSATINNPTKVEQDVAALIQQIYPGKKVVFATYGAEKGNYNGKKINSVGDYMFVESGYVAQAGLETVLDQTVRQSIADTLVSEMSSETADTLAEILSGLDDGVIRKTKNDKQLKDALHQIFDGQKQEAITIDQHKAALEQALYDEKKIKNILMRNKKIHKNLYAMITKQLNKNQIKRKNKATQKELHELLEIKRRYINSLASYVASPSDIEVCKSDYAMNADDINRLETNVVPTYLNRRYALMTTDHTKNTAERFEIENTLSNNRADPNKEIDFDYSRLLDETYYKEDFVKEVMTANPDKNTFSDALYDWAIGRGFVLSPQNNTIYEAVDLEKQTTSKFRDTMESMLPPEGKDANMSLYDIIKPKFFEGRFAPEDIDKIHVNIQTTTDGDVIKGQTDARDPNNIIITITLRTSGPFVVASPEKKSEVILHEVLHALSGIQGLPAGASYAAVELTVSNMSLSIKKMIGNVLLDKTFMEDASQEEFDKALAHAIYRNVDGELLAEGKIAQVYRGDIRDYFSISKNKLIGHGKLKMFVLDYKSPEVSDFAAKKTTSQGVATLIKKELAKQNITNLEEYGFSETFIGSLNTNTLDKDLLVDLLNEKQTAFKRHPQYPKQIISTVIPNATGVGSEKATNFIINLLYPNRSFKDINEVNSFIQMIPTLAYAANDMENGHWFLKSIEDTMKSKGTDAAKEHVNILTESYMKDSEFKKLYRKLSDALDKPVNARRIVTFILKNNVDFDDAAIRDLTSALLSPTGLSAGKYSALSTDAKVKGKDGDMTTQQGAEDNYDGLNKDDEEVEEQEPAAFMETGTSSILEVLHPDDISIALNERIEKYLKSIIQAGLSQNISSFEQLMAIKTNEKIRELMSDRFGPEILNDIDEALSKENFLNILANVVAEGTKNDRDKLSSYFNNKARKSRLIKIFDTKINTDISKVLKGTYIDSKTSNKIKAEVKKSIEEKSKKEKPAETETKIKQTVVEPTTAEPVKTEAKPVEAPVEAKSKEATPKAEPVEVAPKAEPKATEVKTQVVEPEQMSFFKDTPTEIKEKVQKKATRIKKTLQLQNAPVEATQTAINLDIATDKTLSDADRIMAFVEANAGKKYSEYQKIMPDEMTDKQKREYTALSLVLVQNASFLFSMKQNYAKIRAELIARNTDISRASLSLLDTFMWLYASSDSKVRETIQTTTTQEAQALGLRGVTFKRYAPISHLKKELTKKGMKTTMTDAQLLELIGKYDARVKNRGAELKRYKEEIKKLETRLIEMGKKQEELTKINSELETLTKQLAETDAKNTAKIKELNKEIKDLNKQAEQLNVSTADQTDALEDLKQLTENINVLENGTPEEVADWAIRTTPYLKERTSKKQNIVDGMLKQYIKDTDPGYAAEPRKLKNNYAVAFPKATAKLKQISSTLRAFRYTAMLSSPITMVRNKVNNEMMVGLDKATKAVERKIIEHSKITKLYDDPNQFKLTDKVDVGLKNYIHNKYNKVIFDALGTEKNRYDSSASSQTAKHAETEINKKSKNAIIKGLAYAQDLVYKGLETGPLGDRTTLTKLVVENMAMFTTANSDKILNALEKMYGTVEQIQKKSSIPAEQKAILIKAMTTKDSVDIFEAALTDADYFTNTIMKLSSQRACEQLFKNDNAFSNMLLNISEKSPVADFLIGFIMPFYKVGSNIISMAYKYSPLNFINALKQTSIAEQVTSADYKGYIKGTEVAEAHQKYAQATVGTVLWTAGMFAAMCGLIDYDEDDYLGPAVNMFGIRVGLSNAAPSLTTFSLGAVLMDSFKKGEGVNINKLAGVLYDNTLLGSIENMFKYDTESTLEGATVSYLTSYIPAVMKLITKTIDPYSKDKTGNLSDKLWKSLVASIPGLSYMVPSKINAYTGQMQTHYGSDDASFWGMIENIMGAVSPFDVSFEDKYTSELQKEAERLGAGTTGTTGRFTYNGNDVAVLGNEKEALSKFRANYINTQYDKIVSGKQLVTVEDENGKRITTQYSKLTDTQKKNVIDKLYTDATSYTKVKYWVDSGNYYYTSNQNEYDNLIRVLGKNTNIKYNKTWSKSKFVEK